MRVHLLAQLLGVGQGGSKHAGHLAGQEGVQGGAQGQPGVLEHAAARPVMYLQSRTELSSECSVPDTQQATVRMTKAREAAQPQWHAPDAAGERLRSCHIHSYEAGLSSLCNDLSCAVYLTKNAY